VEKYWSRKSDRRKTKQNGRRQVTTQEIRDSMMDVEGKCTVVAGCIIGIKLVHMGTGKDWFYDDALLS
jgi:hypothetical protein